MPDKQIFFDPQRKRWKRLRRILDASAVVFTLVLVAFIFNVLRYQHLPELLLATPRHNYKALPERPPVKSQRPARRKTDRKPSEIPFNSGEGLRAAYYVPYDEASYSSFKQHVHQIDMLFPEWLHVDAPQATLLAIDNETHREYPVVNGATVHDPDDLNKIKRVIQAAKEDTEVFPHLNNVNPSTQSWDPAIAAMLADAGQRAELRQQIVRFLTALPAYHGISLDFESLPDNGVQGYLLFIQELYGDLHARNLRLYVSAAISTPDNDLKLIAANSDGVVLMNYDEHQTTSEPGPIASQEWFVNNLRRVLAIVPKEKLICAIGNYGYDWTLSIPNPKDHRHLKPQVLNTEDFAVSEALQRASDADADLDLDNDSLNPHFEYIDEDLNQRHVVWFLDGVTVLNELRAARGLGLQTFALWRLGEEDSSLWSIWDKPTSPDALQALGSVAPGHDVDTEGDGDVIRITGLPQPGKRTVTVDTDELDPRKKLIVDEHMDVYPRTYTIEQYGYHANQVALSFDDGPDPKWTPKILNVLKDKGVKGTFFIIGDQAAKNVGLLKRVVREGHEIGNHTWSHPDISEISNQQLDLELKFTERLFASKLGIQPLYFRPPYDIDEEPETDDQAAPVERVQRAGYTIIGSKLDTNDWNENPRKTPTEITQAIIEQLEIMKTKPQFRGSIILLHDGGGDRSATVAALPVLIDSLRARGYTIVPVSALMGKTTAEVMPKLTFRQYLRALPDSIAFSSLAIIGEFLVMVFFVGDILMSGRLILVGIFAVIDRLLGVPSEQTEKVSLNTRLSSPIFWKSVLYFPFLAFPFFLVLRLLFIPIPHLNLLDLLWRSFASALILDFTVVFNKVFYEIILYHPLRALSRLLNKALEPLRKLRRGNINYSPGFNPRVAVLIPAYNEEKVIVRTIRSVLNSDYANLRIIVIDDGSSDRTAEVARQAYAAQIAAGRVQVLSKPNGGKAAALNFALDRLTEEFYVGIDADTVIAPDAISKLIPHFEDPLIGAVAGNAKVGNRVNLWTRWQALEYITSQNFERRALDLFNVVVVVPGAIGAWRTGPVKAVGGYPINTVAEDADLTMALLEQKLKVVYEDRALAFTEAPIDAKGLMRQRFRWSFGILQAVWKHRMAFVRNKAMGLFALPNILIFQMLLPLVSPFIDLMFVWGVINHFIDRYFHPESSSPADFYRLLIYFLGFLVIDFVTSSVAFSLERRHPANKGDGWLLFHIWLQRFAYRQVFSIVLFKTVKRAIDGKPFNWDKLERTAKMSKSTDALTETP